MTLVINFNLIVNDYLLIVNIFAHGVWYFLKRYRFGNVPFIRISNDINLFNDEFIKIRETESFIIFLGQSKYK